MVITFPVQDGKEQGTRGKYCIANFLSSHVNVKVVLVEAIQII